VLSNTHAPRPNPVNPANMTNLANPANPANPARKPTAGVGLSTRL
jgi:hypothetical protein